MVGRQIGAFSVVQQIYAGSKAEIYLARRRGPGGFSRPVVLKRLARKVKDDDAALRALLDEGHLQGLVLHPNVVPVHEVAVLEGEYHLVKDWVDGVDLAQVIEQCLERGGPMPVQHSIYTAREVTRGLHAAHTARDDSGSPAWLIHRDVCPRNVLMGWDGTVRLTDFGIAQAARRLSDTRLASVKGTPGYMSPEQASAADVDARSDLFSLGVCLYEMVTGVRPFSGETPEEMVLAAREGDYEPASNHAAHLPEGFDDLLAGFMARLPRLRFTSARDAEVALSRYLHHLDPDYSGADLPGFLTAIFPDEEGSGDDSADTDVFKKPV